MQRLRCMLSRAQADLHAASSPSSTHCRHSSRVSHLASAGTRRTISFRRLTQLYKDRKPCFDRHSFLLFHPPLRFTSHPYKPTRTSHVTQLFAALLIVNLLHVRGVAGSKQERASLECCLTRAYEDATEEQVRETINIGLRRISMLNSRRERMKVGAMKRVSRALNRISLSAKGPAGGSAAAADLPPTTSVFVSAPLDQGRPNSGRSVSKALVGGVKVMVGTASSMAPSSRRIGGGHTSMQPDSAYWDE